MELQSGDNAFLINQKLKNLLNNEDEHQYLKIEKEYILNSTKHKNFKSTSNPIQINNPYLINSEALMNIFYTPWIYCSYITPNIEYSFDESLSTTMCSILFWNNKEPLTVDTYNNYKKINNLLLPNDIKSFRLKINDTKDNKGNVVSRILNLYDNKNNINIEINIEPDTEDGLYYEHPILIFDKGR